MVRDITGKHDQYYEAILQLRDVEEKVHNMVIEEIMKCQIYSPKQIELKNGIDIYLADNKFTLNLVRELQKRFIAEVKVSTKLFTVKDGKELHRVTILFRQFPFNRGDIVEFNGDEYEILSVYKDILMKSGNKKIHVQFKDASRIRRLS